ncbi:hypothetical protein, partial [Stieleria sp.]|uniref:hypothetical protein n=1 Tax=Stieleria sp. TaxID=2795976 RepID=UPI0035621EC3
SNTRGTLRDPGLCCGTALRCDADGVAATGYHPRHVLPRRVHPIIRQTALRFHANGVPQQSLGSR